jgi:hypothetical protein
MFDVDTANENESTVQEILSYLLETDRLDGAARGIALQVIHMGLGSMSERQRIVFDRYIGDYLIFECSRCHLSFPAGEVVDAVAEGDGLCSWCKKMVSNDD